MFRKKQDPEITYDYLSEEEIQTKANKTLDKWAKIKEYETTTPERKALIDSATKNLNTAIATQDGDKILGALSQFKTPEMLKIQNKVPAPTADARKLIHEIEQVYKAAIADLKESNASVAADRKKMGSFSNEVVPQYKKDRVMVLGSTIRYLENEITAESLTAEIQDRTSYNKTPPSDKTSSYTATRTTHTESLVRKAFELKGDKFPSADAEKKQESEHQHKPSAPNRH